MKNQGWKASVQKQSLVSRGLLRTRAHVPADVSERKLIWEIFMIFNCACVMFSSTCVACVFTSGHLYPPLSPGFVLWCCQLAVWWMAGRLHTSSSAGSSCAPLAIDPHPDNKHTLQTSAAVYPSGIFEAAQRDFLNHSSTFFSHFDQWLFFLNLLMRLRCCLLFMKNG